MMKCTMKLTELPRFSKYKESDKAKQFLKQFGDNRYVLLKDVTGNKPTAVVPASGFATPLDQHVYLYKLKRRLEATKSKYHHQNESIELEYVFYSHYSYV